MSLDTVPSMTNVMLLSWYLDVRLVNGNLPNEGRLEVLYNGEWGTVCANGWDLIDADVVCKEMGYPGAEDTFMSGEFGIGDGPILLDGVNCSGNETFLLDCPSNEYYSNNCSHDQDVGLKCLRESSVIKLT